MKKQLLCTSAIALGVAAAPAMAQEWSVNVGGYYVSHITFSDVSGTSFNAGGNLAGSDFDGLEIFNDAEVVVAPSITLDNGLTFGATIQYETADGADMDEVYITVSSDTFGTLDIGAENSAGYKLMWGAGTPSVGGIPINSGSMSGAVPYITSGSTIVNSFVGAGQSQATEVGSTLYGNSDIQRISYYTPDFNGLTVGVSYAPDTGAADGASALGDKNAVALTDIFDIGIGYSQTFGTTDIALAARWGTGDSNVVDPFAAVPGTTTSDPETWGIAATATFGAISVGGHYAENDQGFTGGTFDEEGWGLGVTYDAAGPWSFGIEYFYGEGDHGTNGLGTKDEYEAIKIAANRNLGPGVDWTISLVQTNVDAADAAAGGLLGGDTGTDVEATTLASTISLSF